MKKIILGAFILFSIVSANAQVAVTATGGTASTSYSTLKAAFDAINAGTHTTIITIGISANTTEASSAVLNANGAGSASYASILIQPTGSAARIISGSIAGALISLNGADNVTIDGLNTGNNSLKFVNQSTSASASVFSFDNEATTNTLTNCSLEGSTAQGTSMNNTAAARAVIYFGATASASGNSSNVISNNDIGAYSTSLPWCLIFSYGNATYLNSNTISGNVLHDFYKNYSSASFNNRDAAIFVSANNNSWVISSNKIFQSATRNKTGSSYQNRTAFILLQSGGGHTINANSIGGSAADNTGTMTYTGNNFSFYGVEASNLSTTVKTNITNNTLANVNFTSSYGEAINWGGAERPRFAGIQVQTGYFDVTGNTIGSLSANGSIVITQTATNNETTIGFIFAYGQSSTIIIDNINNNHIGGINIVGDNLAPGGSPDFPVTGMLIYKVNVLNINGNIVGSNTISNSINIAANATATDWGFQGIWAWYPSSSSTSISNNSIRNISFTGGASGSGTQGLFYGISATSSSANLTVNDNIIKNLSSSYGSTSGNGRVFGLYVSTNGKTFEVKGNHVTDLNSTLSFVDGITVEGTAAGYSGIVANNFLNNYTTAAGAFMRGLVSNSLWDNAANAGTNVYNNIVSLNSNDDKTVMAVYIRGKNTVYFNTAYISGSGANSSTRTNCFFFINNSTNLPVVFKNNIAFNNRTRTSGTQPNTAAYLYSGLSNLTMDYNNLYAPDIGGTVGNNGSTGYSTIAAWRTATSQDANSLNVDPTFVSAGGAATSHYYPTTMQAGVTVSGITLDFNGETRNSTPMMGALETQCPTSITAATSTDITLTYTTAFAGSITSVTITTSAGTATFSGSNISSASTTSVRIPDLSSPTSGISTIVDTDYSNVSAGIVTTDGTTTLTCGISMPLPITLLNFDAAKHENDVYLTWETGSESNTDKFEIERSKDGLLFSNIGQVKAAGNSSTIKTYTFLDKNVGITFSDQKQYYRFKQIDFDGMYTFSPLRRIQFTQNLMGISVYPNPTNNTITIQASTYQEGSPYSITDHAGRQVLSGIIKNNKTAVDISYLTEGIYFVQVGESSKEIVKIVKY